VKEQLSASEVLDAHRKLRDGLDDPGLARVRNAFTVTPDSARERIAGMFYPARNYEQLRDLLKADLAGARTYQVTADMVGAISGAREEAGKRPLFLKESQVPFPAGFVWLDKPVPMDPWTGILVRALSWGHQPLPAGAGAAPGIRIAAWNGVTDHDGHVWTKDWHDLWMRATGGRQRLILAHGGTYHFGLERAGLDDAGALRWLRAMWTTLAAGAAATSQPGIGCGGPANDVSHQITLCELVRTLGQRTR
jgi:hypothetical protein